MGRHRSAPGLSDGTGTRRGSASTASKSPCTTTGASTAGTGAVSGDGPTPEPSLSPARSRTHAATWLSVGKSRNCRLSSRSTPYLSRTAANTSACLTVSTPRSASKSRSGSNKSAGYPVISATTSVTAANTSSASAPEGVTPTAAAVATAALGAAPKPARSRTHAATWLSVGKSRNCRLSSRSTPYFSRTAANTSACLTVSTPRSASRVEIRLQQIRRIPRHLRHHRGDRRQHIIDRDRHSNRRAAGAAATGAAAAGAAPSPARSRTHAAT